MNKQFIAVIIVVTAALIALFSFNNKSKDNEGSNDTKTNTSQGSEHTEGEGKKGVTLVEFGDFQCPACRQYFPLVKELKTAYGEDLKFQFRHFPLTSLHPNAFLGSRAAEAAGKQGKFFEMHDLLYTNQDEWSKAANPTSVLESYASQLSLNIEQFKKDMTSSEVNAIINADLKAGQAIGANSTPTFVLNGKKVEENPRSVDDFKKLIDEAAAKQ
jgi:protein-disulfide isomerase